MYINISFSFQITEAIFFTFVRLLLFFFLFVVSVCRSIEFKKTLNVETISFNCRLCQIITRKVQAKLHCKVSRNTPNYLLCNSKHERRIWFLLSTHVLKNQNKYGRALTADCNTDGPRNVKTNVFVVVAVRGDDDLQKSAFTEVE